MEEEQDFVDYYKVLECDRTVSSDDLKKSYKRLILSSHPDKVENQNDEIFLRIQKAWSVLKDPVTRKQYDAMLSCHENSDCLLYDTISLTDMDFNFSEGYYSYPCRCGGTYILENSEVVPSKVIIGCDECSFSIQVNGPS
ncbi:hypothetical protein PYW07_003809 [Mythimna separata]|uniref:DPH4 homolog n=1 Tax=Mythimna separata TaxID=271217 RepID=A0AAD7YPU8_MYTSE|nr:hypothetical protein PYW07_003809 [Mythimna separata]